MTWDANGSPVCDETGATPKCECGCGERPPTCDYTGTAPFTPCRLSTFRAFTPTGMRQLDPNERTTITWDSPEPTYSANLITWPTPVSLLL